MERHHADEYPSSLLTLRDLQDDFEKEYRAGKEKEQSVIHKYIARVECSDRFFAGDLGSGFEWMNTSRPLTAVDFRGRVVVVEFFTYCCINCQHVLPVVKLLEEECPESTGLLVVGVHSGKFEHEKQLNSVGQALLRLGITHPVVNDSSCELWQRFRVNCWPTFVVLGPLGQTLLVLIGEGAVDLLRPFAKAALQYFQPCHLGPLPLQPGALPSGPLLFPAKVLATGDHLIIADTGHHRILVADSNGKLLHIVGGSNAGFRDGEFSEARFKDPQGIVWRSPHYVYVADTGNHAIREINCDQKTVHTVAGTGYQGFDRKGGNLGSQQALSSPWDLCIVGDVLFIAMAGSHQLWALFLEDGHLFGKQYVSKGTCICAAGNGNEENRNNTYPLSASFAQPSGIAFCPPRTLCVADSESSSIRTVSLENGSVKNLVGGALNPTDLFCFGDCNGVALNAKLQHPLGVSWSAQYELLYVADSYNHKIRQVQVKERLCNTLAGTGVPGHTTSVCLQEAMFNEPGGLSVLGSLLYVADTNNHCIKLINLSSGFVETVAITLPDGGGCVDPGVAEEIACLTLMPGACLDLVIEPPPTLASGAPHQWRVCCNKKSWELLTPCSGSLGAMAVTAKLCLLSNFEADVDILVVLETYLCSGGTCSPRVFQFRIPVVVDNQGEREGLCRISKQMYASLSWSDARSHEKELNK